MTSAKYQTMIDNNGHLHLTAAGHAAWMADNNPEEWDDDTWRAYVERIATDARFERIVRDAFKARHAWAEAEVIREIGARKVDAGFRIELRRRINVEAVSKFGRPHPTADGWVPSKHFDPIAGLTRSMNR